MEKWCNIWVLIFILLLVVICVDKSCDYQELKEESQAKEQTYEFEKAELEKQIRLLKTDIDILQNGHEGGKENGKN